MPVRDKFVAGCGGTRDAALTAMGMLLVLAAVVAVIGVGWLFLHALRADGDDTNRHGWLAVVPLAVIFGWVVEQLVLH